ncbi:MAG: radical SAM protein, partial [Alphaproteobacteria bacterium]|nr:radical SAM protein [Alphaproteobacteria bacterium]
MKIKNNAKSWQDGMAKTITFIVTKDCQLACKYCYLVGKNEKERMSWEIAKASIDYVLNHETDQNF